MKTKNNYQKILTFFELFLISLFVFPNISRAADISASVSRTSGVAPLSVHFNADLTASSETERSFHDLEYAWNFGDPNSGNWGTDNKPKNEDKGPIAAHVYETPGIYTATLTVRDANGIVGIPTEFTITVEDPDVVFAGTKTTCISTGTDFSGCPVGASHVTTSDLSGIGSYADAGERILFHRGSSWTINSTISFFNNNGPVHIGAYGICLNPDELNICSNAPIITITAGEFLSLNHKNNWRLADINFSAAKIGGIFSGSTNIKHNLFSRLQSTGFNVPVSWGSQWRYNDTDFIDQNTLYSGRFSDVGLNVAYIGGERLTVLGNIFQNADTSHVVRIWQGYLSVIGHNIMSGSSLLNTSGRHALKFHGPVASEYYGSVSQPCVGSFSETGNGGLAHYSQFAVVSNNIFGASGPWPVSIGPQNGALDERVSDILIEKNKMIAGYGQQNPMSVTVGLMFEGRYISARNNLIDGTGSSGTNYTGISVARRGIEWTPLGNMVYNNTIYNPNTLLWENIGIAIDDEAADTMIRNNYISYPNVVGGIMIDDNSTTAVTSDNIMIDPYFIDPANVNPLLRDFKLTLSAIQAIDQGAVISLFDDFSGQSRIGAYDIGAFEYQALYRADVDNSGGITTTDALLTLRNSLGLDMNSTAWQVSATTGDVNCDNVSNSADALLILRYSLGLGMEETNWCEE